MSASGLAVNPRPALSCGYVAASVAARLASCASSASQGNRGLHGLEITCHEAMHQWDEEIDARMRKVAKAHNVKFDDLLSHAMVF